MTIKRYRLSDLNQQDPEDLMGHCVYLAADVDAELARKDRRIAELVEEHHRLLGVNPSVHERNALKKICDKRHERIEELQTELQRMRRAIDWCLEQGAEKFRYAVYSRTGELEIPKEFDDLIKPR